VTLDYSQVVGPITTSKNFFVVEGDGSVEPEIPSGGGSGGGSDITAEVILEEEEALVILDIDPDELEIERGGVSYLMVEMKNNLDWDLVGVEAELVVEGQKIGSSGVLDLLPMGEKVVLPVKVAVDKDYVSGFYSGVLRVYSGGVSSDMAYSVSVFDSKEELLEYRKSRLENRLDNLRARTVVADNEGFEVKVVFDSIQRMSLDFDLFDDRLKARKYLESVEYLERIENDIEEAEYELDRIIDQDRFGWLAWVLIAGIVFLLVLIIIVLIVKMRKVLNRMHFETLRRRYVRRRKRRVSGRRSSVAARKLAGGMDKDYLKTLREQYHYGYISKAAYDEARGRMA